MRGAVLHLRWGRRQTLPQCTIAMPKILWIDIITTRVPGKADARVSHRQLSLAPREIFLFSAKKAIA